MAVGAVTFFMSVQPFLIAPASATFLHDSGVRASAGVVAIPVLVMGSDKRLAAEEYAAKTKTEVEQLKRVHAASGLVECGDAHGAGQLTLTNDVITTAAHVFYDEDGQRRGKTCHFVVELDGKQKRVPIDMASIVSGTARPYATKTVRDWAVAKLVNPLNEITPYDLAPDLKVNEAVEFVARGHSDWGDGSRMSFEECRLRAQTAQAKNGSREFAFDCNTGDGASGGAVLLGDDRRRLGAILVGWRSDNPTQPKPFSSAHYNFVVSVEGQFRRALAKVAHTNIGGNSVAGDTPRHEPNLLAADAPPPRHLSLSQSARNRSIRHAARRRHVSGL